VAALKFFARLREYLTVLGIPGLLLISFLDSAAVPMAGGPDGLLLLLAWQRPELAWLITITASVGSLLGCLVLYRIGRVGGEVALARFGEKRRAWVKDRIDRHAFLAVLASVCAPPPFPTKLVILAAGAFRMSMAPFMLGVLAGRLFRYGLEAYLAATYGDQAAAILKHRYPQAALGILAIIAVVVLVRWIRHRSGAGVQ
jgi:membrane protein YqaA with SNARE-associated domain